MRIICPDCDAQYEVPDDVIPAGGRDVQCSNCGTTWFFDHPESPPPPRSDTRDSAAEDENVEAVPAPRRELDPKVADILRAEAEREASARAKEAAFGALEVQTELGLTEGSAKPRRQVENMEDRSSAPPATSAAESAPGNVTVAAALAGREFRRDRLPDIEEINSTLRSNDEAEEVSDVSAPTEAGEPPRRRGFGSGLVFALVVFAAFLLAYLYAPEIADAVPEADPWLSSYVTWVEEMRVELDTQLRSLLEWLDAQAAALSA